MMRNFDALNRSFTYPEDILRWAVESYEQRIAVVTSFQVTGIVTLHMLNQLGASVDVLTLATGLLFPETYALMDDLQARFGFNLIRVKPQLSVEQQAEQYGDALWTRDPDSCCAMRKVAPLKESLTGYEAWITGLRHDQSKMRSSLPAVSWDKRNENVKVCPFIDWTEEMVWTYIRAYDLPYNALHDKGYPSIGCAPCTQAVQGETDDLRAGRWINHAKSECGIHV